MLNIKLYVLLTYLDKFALFVTGCVIVMHFQHGNDKLVN